MYRLREMEIDDKVCEQVSLTMLSEVYPQEVIKRCVEQSQPWSSKARRVRASNRPLSLKAVDRFGVALASRSVRRLTCPRSRRAGCQWTSVRTSGPLGVSCMSC